MLEKVKVDYTMANPVSSHLVEDMAGPPDVVGRRAGVVWWSSAPACSLLPHGEASSVFTLRLKS
jgi:hypothetical protein